MFQKSHIHSLGGANNGSKVDEDGTSDPNKPRTNSCGTWTLSCEEGRTPPTFGSVMVSWGTCSSAAAAVGVCFAALARFRLVCTFFTVDWISASSCWYERRRRRRKQCEKLEKTHAILLLLAVIFIMVSLLDVSDSVIVYFRHTCCCAVAADGALAAADEEASAVSSCLRLRLFFFSLLACMSASVCVSICIKQPHRRRGKIQREKHKKNTRCARSTK